MLLGKNCCISEGGFGNTIQHKDCISKVAYHVVKIIGDIETDLKIYLVVYKDWSKHNG